MAAPFDPTRAIRFHLEDGHVELSDGQPQVLVPLEALMRLVAGEPDGPPGTAARELGHAIGAGVVERVASRLMIGARGFSAGDIIRAASLPTIVEHLGGELALLGLGSLRVERWGKAMLFVLDPCPFDARADDLLAGLFEAALSSAAGREVSAAVIERTGRSVRVLVGVERATERARFWASQGVRFAEIVARLHEGVDES